MPSAETHHVETPVAGRCLVTAPAGSEPRPLLLGFHGYAQTAEDQLEMLQRIHGSGGWVCCAVQALHPFYPRPDRVGACWMTRQDRGLRIAENVRYVHKVVESLRASHTLDGTLVLHGFSQGVGMACRAAVLGGQRPAGVILAGGDIPPELDDLQRMGRVLIARGGDDSIYPREKWDSDIGRLRGAGVPFIECGYEGGHAPTDHYFTAAGAFLRTHSSR
jgi:predicted esterase